MTATTRRTSRRESRRGSSRALVFGLLVVGALTLLYPRLADRTQQPLAVFMLPVVLLAVLGDARSTAIVGVVAFVAAAGVGSAEAELASAALGARLAIMATAVALAVVLSTQRQRRDRALRALLPELEAALRTTRALHAGLIGTWHWDSRSGAVVWDDDLQKLFGMPPGTFAGTFEAWLGHLHPDDRERVVATVSAGVDGRSVFAFDHRCVWPNGEVHWLEGAGDVVLDEDGSVVGASGVAHNIDERVALLDTERRHRDRVAFLARTNRALVESAEVGEVMATVAGAAVPALADWCTVVVTVDQPAHAPLIVTAHTDPALVQLAAALRERFPYDPDGASGLPAVVRTGAVEFTPEVSDELLDRLIVDSDLRAVVAQLDLRSSIVVPLRGSLGVLGALQLVRSGARAPFGDGDRQLAEDLAEAIAVALNGAVLAGRQAAAHRALLTLQHLTVGLVEATSSDAVARIVVATAAGAVAADRCTLFVGDPQELSLAASVGVRNEPPASDRALAVDAIHDRRVVRVERPADGAGWRESLDAGTAPARDGDGVGAVETAVAFPLLFRGRATGSLVVGWCRPYTLEETEEELLRQVVSRTAGALERLRLFEHQAAVAATLQHSLLPAALHAPAWLDVAASYWTADLDAEVGGDFYDVVVVDDHACVLLIGDVCGKGVEAATLTAVARHTARATIPFTSDPSDVLLAVHRAVRAFDGTNYITLCAVRLVRDGHVTTADVSLAGHPAPVLRRGDATSTTLGRPGTLLGLIEPVVHTTRETLVDGDVVVLYTDGVTDAPGPAALDPAELAAIVAESDPAPGAVIDAVLDAVRRRRPNGAADDTALLVARVRPPASGAVRAPVPAAATPA